MTEDELAALLRDPDGLTKLAMSIGQGDPNEARYWSRSDLGRSSPSQSVVVAVLRKMSELFADGFRRAGHPVGPKHYRRQPQTMRPVQRVRPQGRNNSASRMGRR
jgi:hypothetical protein